MSSVHEKTICTLVSPLGAAGLVGEAVTEMLSRSSAGGALSGFEKSRASPTFGSSWGSSVKYCET